MKNLRIQLIRIGNSQKGLRGPIRQIIKAMNKSPNKRGLGWKAKTDSQGRVRYNWTSTKTSPVYGVSELRAGGDDYQLIMLLPNGEMWRSGVLHSKEKGFEMAEDLDLKWHYGDLHLSKEKMKRI